MADTGLASIITDTIKAAQKQREAASKSAEAILGDLQQPTDLNFNLPPATSIGNTAVPSAMAAIASAISGNKLFQQANIGERQQEQAARIQAESDKNRLTAQDIMSRHAQILQVKLGMLDKELEGALSMEQHGRALQIINEQSKTAEKLAKLNNDAEMERARLRAKTDVEVANISANRYLEAAKVAAGLKGAKFDTVEGIGMAAKQLTQFAADAAQAFSDMQNKNKNLKPKDFWKSDIGKQFTLAKEALINAIPLNPVKDESPQQWVNRRQLFGKPVTPEEVKKYFPNEKIEKPTGMAPPASTGVKPAIPRAIIVGQNVIPMDDSTQWATARFFAPDTTRGKMSQLINSILNAPATGR